MVEKECQRARDHCRYLDLVNPKEPKYVDLKTLHAKRCKKYFCLCRRHTISVIHINDTKKLYWFNSRSVEEKIRQGVGEGYYCKLLNIVNKALDTWARRYIEGLSFVRKEIMFKINGSATKNMKLLKESCYCHYHPHLTADECNADFLQKVVSSLFGGFFSMGTCASLKRSFKLRRTSFLFGNEKALENKLNGLVVAWENDVVMVVYFAVINFVGELNVYLFYLDT